jgi:N-dimethylarginine dimethylaminohydrolase
MTVTSYRRHNTYGELKSLVLGSYYTSDYFRYIEDSKVRSALCQVSDEINQDLEQFEQFLKKKNITVVRPQLPSVEEFYQHLEQHGRLPVPPLQPRNHHSVIGNRLYKIEPAHSHVDQCLHNYCNDVVDLSKHNLNWYHASLQQHINCSNNGIWYRRQKYQELAGPDWPCFDSYVQGVRSSLPHIHQEMQQFESVLSYNTRDFGVLAGPNIFPTDDGVVVDCNEYCDYDQWAQQHMAVKPCIRINTGAGHTDGCFVVLGHRTILGIDPLIDYKQIFPDHTVIPVPDQSYINHVTAFNQMKQQVQGRWWVDGQETNHKFIEFIENYCGAWTGFVEETVFDVNVLAIDPDTVCVSGRNPDIQKKLAQQGIESISMPWRHRFFVDGGLHCITLDLYRE